MEEPFQPYSENAWIWSCDCPTYSCLEQVVKMCRAMAAGSYDIETKKPAVITGNKLRTTSIDIKCINYDTDVLVDAKSMRK